MGLIVDYICKENISEIEDVSNISVQLPFEVFKIKFKPIYSELSNLSVCLVIVKSDVEFEYINSDCYNLSF